MNKMKSKKAMSIVEYGLLIAIVGAALLGIQIYLKRGTCGHWKEAGDVFGFGRQYEPSETTESGGITGSGGGFGAGGGFGGGGGGAK